MIQEHFNLLMYIWIGIAVVLLPVQLKITAPYGRHAHNRWGITISNRFAWIMMEIPALLCFLFFFYYTPAGDRGISWIFLVLWGFHYFNRSLVFPLRIKTSGKEMPVLVMILALFFNLINGSANGYHFGTVKPVYPLSWISDIRFIAGSILFVGGMVMNWYADRILINLRKNSRNGYSIPRGFLFRYISCPNFFGEIIEWIGFAIMAWSLPAFAFVIWSITNLVPRAMDHHRWYRETFEEYPKNRKAIIPYIL